MIPVVHAVHHLKQLQVGATVVAVADETQSVVLEVGKRVYSRFARATVGILPIVHYSIHPEAEVHTERSGVTVVTHHVVVGAVDVEHTDWRDGRLGGIRAGYQSADRHARVDSVTMLDGHTMRHKAAHRYARKENAVSVELILHRQRVEEGHQKTGVINAAGGQTGVPHRAYALVKGLRQHNHPVILLGNLGKIEFLVVIGDVATQTVQEEQHGKCTVMVGRGAHDVFALRTLPGEVLDLGGEVPEQDNRQ